MTVDQYDDSIRIAVERETQRRKRVLLFFVVLLALPLIAGAWVVARAPSQTEAVAKEVAPLVRESVGKSVAEDVVAEAAPLIEQRVATRIEPRITELRDSNTALRQSVESIARIDPRPIPQPPDLTEQIQRVVAREVRTQVQNETERLNAIHQREIEALKARLSKVENQATIRPIR
jgi:hypothetical protein